MGASGSLRAQNLPAGGAVVAGSGSISSSGNTLTVTQTSATMAANWQSFNIGQGHTVNFVQPSASSVALNRVLGADVSVIQGALTANGQVFLVNPNGVLFSPTAQVNVGGLLASTLQLSTADFMAGNYHFEGSSSAAVTNQGSIQAHQGGSIALIAARVSNTGALTAPGGQVLLGAGSRVTLDLGGPVQLQVEQGALDAWIEQGGAIRADGGRVYLTAKALGDLSSTVINHTGTTEAHTLATGEKGEIYLLGGMQNDRIVVGGRLDASAPQGGDGGFIETSAAQVHIQNDIQISTAAPAGRTGQWLIDPVDITIASSGGNITGSAIATALQSTNVTLDTSGAGSCTGAACAALGGTNGDIFVKDDILVSGGSADTTLTLKANRNIFMDAGKTISRTGANRLDTVFWADSDATGGGAIWLGKGNTAGSSTDSTISTNGGNITLSGGSNLSTGYAEGVNGVNGNGVTLDRAQLLSAGGDILVRGKSSSTTTSIASTDSASSTNTDGIRLHGGNTLDAGSGTVSLTGVAQGNTGSSNGIETNQVGYTKILSSSSSATAISLYGDATAGSSSNGWGTFLWGTNTSGILLAATGTGGISLDGYGRNISAGGGTHLEPNTFVLAASGPIAISGTKGAASSYEGIVINSTVGYVAALPAGFGVASPVTASSSNISITTDTLSANRVFGGGAFSGSAVQSTGTLTIAPRTAGKALSVQTSNPGGTGLWINPSSMFGNSGLFKTGFTKLAFGSSTTGTVTLNNYSFDNDTELNTGANVVLGVATIANHALTVNVTGSGSITNTGAVTASKLRLNAASSAATLGNTGNTVGTLAAQVASLSMLNSGALTVGTVGAANGVSATGTVDIATLSGDLTVARSISTTDSSAAAIVLNAGKTAAAGTVAGGDLVLTGSPSITVGAGGRATLMTGSTSNAALTTLVGAGSGNFRYNADETSTPSPALGAGTYALYRDPQTPPPVVSTPVSTPASTPANQQAAIQSAQQPVARPGAAPTGGLAFVDVPLEPGVAPAPTTQQAATSDAAAGSDLAAPRPADPGGAPLGPLQVFVVAGGIHLPLALQETNE